MGRTGFCAIAGLVADNLVVPPWHNKSRNVEKAFGQFRTRMVWLRRSVTDADECKEVDG